MVALVKAAQTPSVTLDAVDIISAESLREHKSEQLLAGVRKIKNNKIAQYRGVERSVGRSSRSLGPIPTTVCHLEIITIRLSGINEKLRQKKI